jgi:hypothetical protein
MDAIYRIITGVLLENKLVSYARYMTAIDRYMNPDVI